MIDLLLQTAGYALALLVTAAWRTLPLLAAVLAIDLLFQRRIAARFHCVLWAMVVARLLMPISIASPLSVHGHIDEMAWQLFTVDAKPAAPKPIRFETFTYEDKESGKTITEPILPADATDEYRAAATAYVETLRAQSLSENHTQLSQGRLLNQIDESETEPYWTWDVVVGVGLILMWLMVSLGLLSRNFISHRKFSRRLRTCNTLSDPRIEDAVLRACNCLGLRRRPVVKEVPELPAPAVFGLWRGTVCLPAGTADALSCDEMDWVMMHEIAHIKRHDAMLLTLATAIRSLHWFNPFAHVAIWRMRHYVEQAADDLAARRLPQSNMANYGRLLLRYASQSPNAKTQPATIGLLFVSSSKRLRRRIEMLDQNSRRNHWLAKTIAAMTILTLGLAGMTDAQPVQYHPVPLDYEFDWSTEWLDEPAEPALAEPLPNGDFVVSTRQRPRLEVTYDVGKVLEKLAAAEPDINPQENLKSYFLHPPGFPGANDSFVSLTDNKLTLKDTKAAHKSTERLLRSFARSGPWQISIESRVVVADPKVASAIDWQHRGILPARAVNEGGGMNHLDPYKFPGELPEHFPGPLDSQTVDTVIEGTHEVAGFLPMIAVKVSPQQAKYFVSRAEREPATDMAQAPKVTLFNGQYAVLSDQSQRPFVTGVSQSEDNNEMQPIIEVVNDGWQMELMAEVTEDEKIDLYCVLTQSEIESVRLATLPFAKDVATVQVPKVNRTSITSTVQLEKGESLLIMSPTTYDPEESTQSPAATFYMLTPRKLMPQTVIEVTPPSTD